MIKGIPDVFIAGSIQHKKKVSEEEAIEIAYHNAAYILDEDNIKLTVSVDKDTVHFIAAKGKDFVPLIESGDTSIHNPLSVALPGKLVGMKQSIHRGDGIYIYPASTTLHHCVVVINKRLYSYTTRVDDIRENYPSLPVIDCSSLEDNLTVEWITPKSWSEKKSYSIIKTTALTGVFMTVISAAMLLISTFLFGNDKSIDKQNEQIVGLFYNVIHSIRESSRSDIFLHLENLQKLSAITEKNRGVIDEYRVENNKITWQMRLPAWVVSSEFAHLDSNITTEFDDSTKEIIVKKE